MGGFYKPPNEVQGARFQKMESMYKILENFLSAICSVRFRRYPADQSCIFIVPDIISHQSKIRMGSYQ